MIREFKKKTLPEELRRFHGKIEEKNPIDYFRCKCSTPVLCCLYRLCRRHVSETTSIMRGSQSIHCCLVGARFLKAASKIGFFPTLSILTPQNWRHFDGPTPCTSSFTLPLEGPIADP